MILTERSFDVPSRSTIVDIYPLGDLHIGSRTCAEKALRRVINEIKKNPHAYWIGGGDYLDAIKPADSKRFDMDTMPDWMLEGNSLTVREKLNDIVRQQFDRCVEILEPIKHKCLGLIEGNHEFSIRKFYNQNIHKDLCKTLETKDLTDESFMLLRFKRRSGTSNVKLYICHGHGGGRSIGSEPNKLHTMLSEWEDAQICLRGHSHTYTILPPKPVLYSPETIDLPKELLVKYRYAANWGCWMLSHQTGPSTYVSRACYPVRPLMTCKVVISPFTRRYMSGKEYQVAKIEIRSITL